MTYEEAHKIIEDMQREYTRNRALYPNELITANGVAIIALEKQIPKKPIKCCPLSDGGEMLDENEHYKCPACRLKFRKTYVFCHYCGQALDWSDTK